MALIQQTVKTLLTCLILYEHPLLQYTSVPVFTVTTYMCSNIGRCLHTIIVIYDIDRNIYRKYPL